MSQIDIAYALNFNKTGNVIFDAPISISRSKYFTRLPLDYYKDIYVQHSNTFYRSYFKSKVLDLFIGAKDESLLSGYKTFSFDIKTDTQLKSLGIISPILENLKFNSLNFEVISPVKRNYFTKNIFVASKSGTMIYNNNIEYSWDKSISSKQRQDTSAQTIMKNVPLSSYSKAQCLDTKLTICKMDGNFAISSLPPSPIEMKSDKLNTLTFNVPREEMQETIVRGGDFYFDVKPVYGQIIVDDKWSSKTFTFNVDIDGGINTTPGSQEPSNVEKIKFVVQKLSFVELYIKFSTKKITNVSGLPDGLRLEGDYIKGSPILSGIYPCKIYSDTSVIMDIIIEVPNVQRKL